MIAFDEGLKLIKKFAMPLGAENVDLFHALKRTLAEDVFSDISMPPFNKSAMDGYACRKSDIKNRLEVIEEIQAGGIPQKTVGANQCAKIMTGAMVPEGADWVIMKEHIEVFGPNQVVCVRESANSNICFTGEDVKTGDLVLKKGAKILSSHIAILASVGCANPLVYQLPTVAVISTGNELVETSETVGISQIRNSNGYQIAAQVQQMGIVPEYLGIVQDDEAAIEKVLRLAIEKYDLTIISGGVSVGDFDFVPKILKRLNASIVVHGMEVKPGKHLLFAEKSQHYIFGMPGNPVSSFVQFEVLVKPFLEALTGKTGENYFLNLPLETDYFRKKSDQLFFVPVTLTKQGTVVPLEYHGSAHIHAYTLANGIMEIPQGVLTIKKGETVCVRPL
jgi:molybdopterin molybdotransferase